MSSNNKGEGLFNFLQQNALFNSSPTKNGLRKSKSRSKDRNTQSNKISTKPKQLFVDDSYNKNKPSNQPLEFNYNNTLQSNRAFNPQNNSYAPPPSSTLLPSHNNSFPLERSSFAADKNTFHTEKNNFAPIPQKTNYKLGSGINGRFETFEPLENPKFEKNTQNRGITEPKQNNQLWTGLVSYSTSFESARIESSQCLQNLGSKLRNEISTINVKIDTFNTKMYRIIADEFKNLRERIFFILQESFKESEKYIREYMKSQQEKLAGDLVKMRETLQKQYSLIEGMKEEIAKPNWRKAAGQIIASQLERKVDQMVKYSAALNVGRWELGDLVGYRLKDLERDLREVVRLKRQP